MENSTRMIWKCGYCNDVVISYSHLVHDMNYCDCSKTAVDLENSYCRSQGMPVMISKKEYKEGKWRNIDG